MSSMEHGSIHLEDIRTGLNRFITVHVTSCLVITFTSGLATPKFCAWGGARAFGLLSLVVSLLFPVPSPPTLPATLSTLRSLECISSFSRRGDPYPTLTSPVTSDDAEVSPSPGLALYAGGLTRVLGGVLSKALPSSPITAGNRDGAS
jgi:hypothetical protein